MRYRVYGGRAFTLVDIARSRNAKLDSERLPISDQHVSALESKYSDQSKVNPSIVAAIKTQISNSLEESDRTPENIDREYSKYRSEEVATLAAIIDDLSAHGGVLRKDHELYRPVARIKAARASCRGILNERYYSALEQEASAVVNERRIEWVARKVYESFTALDSEGSPNAEPGSYELAAFSYGVPLDKASLFVAVNRARLAALGSASNPDFSVSADVVSADFVADFVARGPDVAAAIEADSVANQAIPARRSVVITDASGNPTVETEYYFGGTKKVSSTKGKPPKSVVYDIREQSMSESIALTVGHVLHHTIESLKARAEGTVYQVPSEYSGYVEAVLRDGLSSAIIDNPNPHIYFGLAYEIVVHGSSQLPLPSNQKVTISKGQVSYNDVLVAEVQRALTSYANSTGSVPTIYQAAVSDIRSRTSDRDKKAYLWARRLVYRSGRVSLANETDVQEVFGSDCCYNMKTQAYDTALDTAINSRTGTLSSPRAIGVNRRYVTTSRTLYSLAMSDFALNDIPSGYRKGVAYMRSEFAKYTYTSDQLSDVLHVAASDIVPDVHNINGLNALPAIYYVADQIHGLDTSTPDAAKVLYDIAHPDSGQDDNVRTVALRLFCNAATNLGLANDLSEIATNSNGTWSLDERTTAGNAAVAIYAKRGNPDPLLDIGTDVSYPNQVRVDACAHAANFFVEKKYWSIGATTDSRAKALTELIERTRVSDNSPESIPLEAHERMAMAALGMWVKSTKPVENLKAFIANPKISRTIMFGRSGAYDLLINKMIADKSNYEHDLEMIARDLADSVIGLSKKALAEVVQRRVNRRDRDALVRLCGITKLQHSELQKIITDGIAAVDHIAATTSAPAPLPPSPPPTPAPVVPTPSPPAPAPAVVQQPPTVAPIVASAPPAPAKPHAKPSGGVPGNPYAHAPPNAPTVAFSAHAGSVTAVVGGGVPARPPLVPAPLTPASAQVPVAPVVAPAPVASTTPKYIEPPKEYFAPEAKLGIAANLSRRAAIGVISLGLSNESEALVCNVLKLAGRAEAADRPSVADLDALTRLHPGVREVLISRVITALIMNGNIEQVAAYKAAAVALKEKLKLRKPKPAEVVSAFMDKDTTTLYQRELFDYHVLKRQNVTQEGAEELFRVFSQHDLLQAPLAQSFVRLGVASSTGYQYAIKQVRPTNGSSTARVYTQAAYGLHDEATSETHYPSNELTSLRTAAARTLEAQSIVETVTGLPYDVYTAKVMHQDDVLGATTHHRYFYKHASSGYVLDVLANGICTTKPTEAVHAAKIAHEVIFTALACGWLEGGLNKDNVKTIAQLIDAALAVEQIKSKVNSDYNVENDMGLNLSMAVRDGKNQVFFMTAGVAGFELQRFNSDPRNRQTVSKADLDPFQSEGCLGVNGQISISAVNTVNINDKY